ncbi:hypothetical protein ACP70R_016514 [Stipagrostis hirtigluma subsp. patula]
MLCVQRIFLRLGYDTHASLTPAHGLLPPPASSPHPGTRNITPALPWWPCGWGLDRPRRCHHHRPPAPPPPVVAPPGLLDHRHVAAPKGGGRAARRHPPPRPLLVPFPAVAAAEEATFASDPSTYLSPFLDVVRSEEVPTAATGFALSVMLKVLRINVFDVCSPGACDAIHAVFAALPSCRAERIADAGAEEAVLLRVLQVLAALLRARTAPLSDNVVCTAVNTCFQIVQHAAGNRGHRLAPPLFLAPPLLLAPPPPPPLILLLSARCRRVAVRGAAPGEPRKYSLGQRRRGGRGGGGRGHGGGGKKGEAEEEEWA